jgi:hypothetical protein
MATIHKQTRKRRKCSVKKLASKFHVHPVNYAAKLVHTRHALSSTITNPHQEPVSGQACNLPNPH